MSGVKRSMGRGIKVTVPAAPTNAVIQGNLYAFDGFFGQAMQGVDANPAADVLIALDIEQGFFQSPQFDPAPATAYAKEDEIYWNPATELLTNLATAARLVGLIDPNNLPDANGVGEFLLYPQSAQ